VSVKEWASLMLIDREQSVTGVSLIFFKLSAFEKNRKLNTVEGRKRSYYYVFIEATKIKKYKIFKILF
jgi:hypothetical protein